MNIIVMIFYSKFPKMVMHITSGSCCCHSPEIEVIDLISVLIILIKSAQERRIKAKCDIYLAIFWQQKKSESALL